MTQASYTPLTRPAIEALLADLPAASAEAVTVAKARQTELTKPPGSLGLLEEVAVFMAGWQGNAVPTLRRPLALIFAANHGVTSEGVSPYPPEVTRAMVANFQSGGAAINQICQAVSMDIRVVDIDLDRPSCNFTEEPALTEEEMLEAISIGFESVPRGCDLLCLGEMGIGNTTVAAAIYAALYGASGRDWVGGGTGADEAVMERKIEVVDRGLKIHAPALSEPLEVLRRLGGREIAALVGAMLRARQEKIPVVLDGFVVCAAATLLAQINPRALDHCIAGHVSGERSHKEALRRLGLTPLLDLGMRLGEASGAATAVSLVRIALACHAGMATFSEAAVPNVT